MKIMKKKCLAVLLALGCMLALGACGKKAQEGSAAQTQESTAASENATQEESASVPESTASAQTEGQTEEALNGSYDGIVVDAAMNSMAIDTTEGKIISFGLPEDKDIVSTKDGIQLGQAVKVTFEDGVAAAVEDSKIEPKAAGEVLMYAGDIIMTFQGKNLENIEQLLKYPLQVKVDGKETEVKSKEDFLKLDAAEIFSEERAESIEKTNLFELEPDQDGSYVLGGELNVVFGPDTDSDSGFSITAIN